MITVNPVRSSQELLRFIRLPWVIYHGDPNWVPPLISYQRRELAPFLPSNAKGLRCLFLAEQGGESVGRLAVLIDPVLNQLKGANGGYFSLFECINDVEVAGRLFDSAAGWLRQRSLTMLRGPVSPGGPHDDDCKGLLIEGFDRPPVFMTSYNPSYYSKLLEGCGFSKDFDLYAYLLEEENLWARNPQKLVEYAARRYGFRLQTIDLKNLESEIRDIHRVLELAIPAEWPDVLPPSLGEVRASAERLRQVADPDFVVIARAGEKPVGFAAALPDYNQVFIHMNGRLSPWALLKYFYYKRRITCLRLFITFVVPAFRKRGVPQTIYYYMFGRAAAKGYAYGEGSIVGEQNVEMRRDIESAGGRRYKTYRIFQKAL